MSRFEASGLSGDVPFTVEFRGPASELGAFEVSVPPGKSKGSPKGKPAKTAPKTKSSPPKSSLMEPAAEPSEVVAGISFEGEERTQSLDLDEMEEATGAEEEFGVG